MVPKIAISSPIPFFQGLEIMSCLSSRLFGYSFLRPLIFFYTLDQCLFFFHFEGGVT